MFLDLIVDQKSRIKMMLKSYVRKFHDCFRRGLNLLIFFLKCSSVWRQSFAPRGPNASEKKMDRISVNKANG